MDALLTKIDDLVWRVEQLEERMKDKGQSP